MTAEAATSIDEPTQALTIVWRLDPILPKLLGLEQRMLRVIGCGLLAIIRSSDDWQRSCGSSCVAKKLSTVSIRFTHGRTHITTVLPFAAGKERVDGQTSGRTGHAVQLHLRSAIFLGDHAWQVSKHKQNAD
tara:strand:+ start:133 stop:528 length:396 start_codon:yes stop_codon:yes gene_type:complete